ncbi:MAG: GTP-binding protein [Candidatus Heimdallarchaeota archaeon]|nr:GTP-binding protein [Candidatus Heimdallarchaeota archaeon]MCK4877153.1 GTP-binding protein [Candidatus Heimdallarchaeota archaeon]
MAKKKQPQSKTKKDAEGPVLFEENIDKHHKMKDDSSTTDDKESTSLKTSSYMVKLVLIGDAAVGKTSIRQRYLGKGFQREHLATLGADFAATTRNIDDYSVKYQIWDLAGQPMFKNVRPRFYKGCFGSLAVFDITRKETFQNLTSWIEELYQCSGRGVVPVIILANKTDLKDEREVTIKEAKEFVEKLNEKTKEHSIENFFLETSAKTGLNIEKAFEFLSQYIIDRFSSDQEED